METTELQEDKIWTLSLIKGLQNFLQHRLQWTNHNVKFKIESKTKYEFIIFFKISWYCMRLCKMFFFQPLIKMATFPTEVVNPKPQLWPPDNQKKMNQDKWNNSWSLTVFSSALLPSPGAHFMHHHHYDQSVTSSAHLTKHFSPPVSVKTARRLESTGLPDLNHEPAHHIHQKSPQRLKMRRATKERYLWMFICT